MVIKYRIANEKTRAIKLVVRYCFLAGDGATLILGGVYAGKPTADKKEP